MNHRVPLIWVSENFNILGIDLRGGVPAQQSQGYGFNYQE